MKQSNLTATLNTPDKPKAQVEHQALSDYVKDQYESFSRSQREVAQYIIDHLDEVAFQTAEQLARHANTSSSTVVRFAQALGFDGYPELQASARDEYKRQSLSTSSSKKSSKKTLFSLDQTDFEAAVAADYSNLEDTALKIDREAIANAVEAISTARWIVIAGADQMAFFASYFRHLLMLLDLRAEIVASPSQDSLSRLGKISENSLVVGMSAGWPHPLTLRAMKLAKQRGAATLALSDATMSDVARLADIKLFYSSNSPAYVRSHTALLSLIQALAYAVYSKDSARFDDRIKAFKLK